ncbi:MAG: hypothetical protein H8D23_09210 [Candidatus Brocadiales bacterium]|nr:hypothetical protein [Candidatus Brocadiales bacterium]
MKMLTCPLCNEKVKEFHKRSHLIPEWMYTNCYDEKHKTLEISRLKQKVTKRQKGIYAQFICRNCEKETQIFDHYASLILTDKSPDSPEYKCISKIQNNGKMAEYEIWGNINFIKFQRFILSIILRTQLAEKMNGQISITKKHLKNMLNLYRDNDNDDSSYPIVVYKHPENDKHKNHVILPYINKKDGHHIIEFTGAGFIFNVYVSSHIKPQYVNSVRLKNDGSMYLIIISFKETGLFRNTKLMIKETKNA